MRIFTPINNFTTRYSTYILLTIIGVFAGGSMIMTAANSAATKQVAINTQRTSMDTHNAVEGEKQILAAIKQATLDNALTATQKTNIIICMLQVPESERIPKESDCRKQAVSSGISSNTSQGTSNVVPKASGSSSSSNNAPPTAQSQPNNPQLNGSGVPKSLPEIPILSVPSPFPNICLKVKPIFIIC